MFASAKTNTHKHTQLHPGYQQQQEKRFKTTKLMKAIIALTWRAKRVKMGKKEKRSVHYGVTALIPK